MTGRSTDEQPRTAVRWYGESKSYFALFVLVDLPAETINSILDGLLVNEAAVVWLAHDNLSSIPEPGDGATRPPIDPTWRSPFVGKTITDAVRFLNELPESARQVIDSRHFVVVDQYYMHKGRGLVKAYRIEGDVKDGSDMTWVPGKPVDLMNSVYAYEKGQWEQWLDDFRATGRCMAFGDGDGPLTPPPSD